MKPRAVGIALVLALALAGGGTLTYRASRGLRNNNPGNIRYDGTPWLGLADPPTDGTYCVFISPEYGIRAMAIILTNYVTLDGIPSSVTGLINRWAPPSENDTFSYISAVDAALGLTPDNDYIDLSTELPLLISAMISHENGINPYSDTTIAHGIAMAA